MADRDKKYILLQNKEHPFMKFFTTNNPGIDQTTLVCGTIAYRVLGYADTIEEAQQMLYEKRAL